MKILVVSDTHGRHDGLDKITEMEEPFDMFIHLGDLEGDEDYINAFVNCTIHMVGGNNDYFSSLPREQEFYIKDKKVFITHGHAYYISRGTEGLENVGKVKGADIVMFGHTHMPFIAEKDGMILLNPGSVTYPRQPGREPSYMVITVDDAGEFHFKHKYLK